MWLDEIEEEYDLVTYPSKYIDSPRGQMERMAHVLREAVKLLKIELELASTVDDAEIIRLQIEVLPLLSEMSDDLTELLHANDAKDILK